MKLLLFLVGIALANAATTIIQNNDLEKSITIHRNAPETYPTEFQLSKTHRFNYTGDIRTSFPQTGNETVGQRLQCIVEIYPLTTTLWNMRLVNPTIYEINGTHDKPQWMVNSTKVTEELRELLQYNVSILINQGKIEAVFVNKSEAEWIVNLKKGIMNMISLTVEKDNVYEVDEEGVSGICKTLYTIKENKNEDLVTIMNITKVRDLTNCSKTAFNKLMTFKAKDCDDCEKSKDSMEALATFKYNITGTKQRYIINSVQSDAHYVFFPMGVKGGSVLVHVNQTLKLINVTSDPYFEKSPTQESRGGLTYLFPEIVKVEEDMLNTVQKVDFMLKKLEKQTNSSLTIDSPSYFLLLVRSLFEANYETLEDIWNLVRHKPEQRKWLIEAIPFVNRPDMTLLIKELITTEETLLTTEEKITILTRLGFIRQPSETTVEAIKDICEHRVLQWHHNTKVNTTYVYNLVRMRHACYRSLGIQINSLKKTAKFVPPALVHSLLHCEKHFDDSTKATPWDPTVYKQMGVNQVTSEVDDNLTLEEAQALVDVTKKTKVREMCLVAMGQVGLPDHIPYIEPILHQTVTNQTQDVRIAACFALRKMKNIPNKVLSLLLPILRNPYEDPELRMIAYLVTTVTNKRPSVFTLIGQELNKEKSKQVRSFIYSHLKTLSESVVPCEKDLAIAARYALVFTKPFNLGPTYSKVRNVGFYDHETKLGAKLKTRTMFSEGELTPSRTNIGLEVEMLGKKTNFLEVEMKTSGMTNLLDKMFGVDGHFYKRKSIFDLLKESNRKRRSVSSNEEELNKINKKLSPYEVTPEDPRFRLYISLVGNRILDMDVNKEYLTTLIKEGKFMTDFTSLDEELAKKQMFNTTKGMILMDHMFQHPTIMGMPLSYNTTVASILRIKVNATVKADPSLLLTQNTLKGSFNITPEVVVNAFFKMGCHIPQIKFGSAINSTFNVTLPVHTNISIDFTKKKYEVIFPQIERNLTFLNFTHKIYTFWQKKDEMENQTIVNTTLTNRKPVKKVLCIEPINDTKLCLNVTFTPRLGHPNSPYHPLTGPSYLSIFQNKTVYSPKIIKFKYQVNNPELWETEKNVDIVMTTMGLKHDLMEYENITTFNVRIHHPNKRIVLEVTDSAHPEWRSEIRAVNMDGEVDLKAYWGNPHDHVVKINNTDMRLTREYFLQINSQSWTFNDTRNITIFWAELPQWLKNVTYLTKTYVLPVVLEAIKKTTDTEFFVEPLLNPIVNSTTVSLKIKTNYTMDVEIHLPIEKITVVNVTVPVNTSVLKYNVPDAVATIQRRLTEKFLSGNCTYNHTGTFVTYDQLFYKYNLTGSCPHVLTKDCSPKKRFTVLVQNTRQSNLLVRTNPLVTVYIDNHKIELITRNDEEVYMKYNGIEHLTQRDSTPIETDTCIIERNHTHITVKAKIGLTVVYCKHNVTTSLSPWYVNKTCGMCGDFNGEIFREMKNTTAEEVNNSTKFGASWLVHGDDCMDETCKLTKEDLYALPETVYLANKPAVCFSKEPVKLCPIGCNNESPENIFTSTLVPKKQFVKVPFFCMASENLEETKTLMKTRTDLIRSQPVDLYRDIELPHDCICTSNCNIKV
ncbi:vitellogenin-like [Acanthaster planci]|uniref:Vitellogenin-like n=1 Tax=Acanthaster planci TaxID=133434 RepID=A0A8B7ZK60_ACAPL|nr:vitellogenin-like [Acanthaster planci]